MAWTESDLAALEKAISFGALKVKYQDKETIYRSLAEMMQIRDLMRKELGLTSGTIKAIKPKYSKGL